MSLVEVETKVNGRGITLSVPARMTLAELLRDELGLTGTKISCEMQVCGVCTVLVDRKPVSSCAYLAVDVDGRGVTTIEGLGPEHELHPIQQAMIDHFALQCGFCTPGFVMMTAALLEETPRPTSDQVVSFLEGNICRCTGYRSILEAVLIAADRLEDVPS